MSDDRGPSADASPTPAPPRKRRHPLLTALMVIFGLILLLPGICSVFFMSMGNASEFAVLWLVCFAISAGGIVMLARAAR